MAMREDPLDVAYTVRRDIVLALGPDAGVVRGINRQNGELHALKFISVSRKAYSTQREVELLRRVTHPNVVRLVEVFQPSGTRPNVVFSMPEADCTLQSYLQRSHGYGRLTPLVMCGMSTQLLQGLCCLHDTHHVARRDLKPGNVLVYVVAPTESAIAASQGLSLIHI